MLGNNMFAYCNSNSVNFTDPAGNYAIALDPLRGGSVGGAQSLTPSGDLFAAIVLGVTSLWKQLRKTTEPVSSSSINWGSGDKNHILKGTRKTHIPGWKRFGIDPENGNDNNWSLLLPILKEVVDEADAYKESLLSNGSKIIQFTKYYVDEGVQVVVKIWVSANGAIQQLSDAIPYITDG